MVKVKGVILEEAGLTFMFNNEKKVFITMAMMDLLSELTIEEKGVHFMESGVFDNLLDYLNKMKKRRIDKNGVA